MTTGGREDVQMRRTIALLSLAALTAAFLVGSGDERALAIEDCVAGEICYWGEDSYTGCDWDSPNDNSNLYWQYWDNCYPHRVDQGTNSFKNRGTSCSITMYDYSQYTGGHLWAQREGLGGYWKDANLGNNYWSGSSSGSSGTVVENDITSHNFCP